MAGHLQNVSDRYVSDANDFNELIKVASMVNFKTPALKTTSTRSSMEIQPRHGAGR
jgi:hypothetical protein